MIEEQIEHALKIANNFRYERKYIVPKSMHLNELVAIVKDNSAHFREVFHERQVNNIYFDTNDFKYYFDNVDGVADRQKVRIRWYEDILGSIKNPKLEIKIKNGLVGDKWTYDLNSFTLDSSITGRDLGKLFHDSNLPRPIYEIVRSLNPTLINSYTRRYFISANQKFRITLDYEVFYRNIKTRMNNFSKMPQSDPFNVVELKYGLEDDGIANSISAQFPFRLSKNSKYVNGVNNFQSFPE
ncbi:polyphosphate polymerase domain-containing protein [Maribacter algarum]|uniref:Polyphosphate polymerase domain-containing protein n=1 Tax=Maribacter algarum (ex Zhang et al. 2020) TaxID=2578118 RepID=A0A5S3PVF0_9FLAO|nr:polyphosphate polymerase domain-containing protein [Maribacter algarum]TMM58943.1 polyphosphate polymerase domain-containing protein [Maribacter algarum]